LTIACWSAKNTTSSKPDMSLGVYPLEAERIYMSISIGEPFGGYCYKLIASILAQPY
jgi:hypothetical protein